MGRDSLDMSLGDYKRIGTGFECNRWGESKLPWISQGWTDTLAMRARLGTTANQPSEWIGKEQKGKLVPPKI
jgi:hypothetical protein